MICKKCNSFIEDRDTIAFCPNCGEPIDREALVEPIQEKETDVLMSQSTETGTPALSEAAEVLPETLSNEEVEPKTDTQVAATEEVKKKKEKVKKEKKVKKSKVKEEKIKEVAAPKKKKSRAPLIILIIILLAACIGASAFAYITYTEKVDLEATVDDQKAEIKDYEKDVTGLKKDIEDATVEKEMAESTVKTLEDTLSYTEETIRDLEDQVDNVDETIEELETENDLLIEKLEMFVNGEISADIYTPTNGNYEGKVLSYELLSSDMRYLQFDFTLHSLNDISEYIDKKIGIKIIDPTGTVMTGDVSESFYSYELNISSDYMSAGWGNNDESIYTSGLYAIELYYMDELIGSRALVIY